MEGCVPAHPPAHTFVAPRRLYGRFCPCPSPCQQLSGTTLTLWKIVSLPNPPTHIFLATCQIYGRSGSCPPPLPTPFRRHVDCMTHLSGAMPTLWKVASLPTHSANTFLLPRRLYGRFCPCPPPLPTPFWHHADSMECHVPAHPLAHTFLAPFNLYGRLCPCPPLNPPTPFRRHADSMEGSVPAPAGREAD